MMYESNLAHQKCPTMHQAAHPCASTRASATSLKQTHLAMHGALVPVLVDALNEVDDVTLLEAQLALVLGVEVVERLAARLLARRCTHQDKRLQATPMMQSSNEVSVIVYYKRFIVLFI